MMNHPPTHYDDYKVIPPPALPPYVRRKIPHYDFWDFVERNYNRLFRFWVYRRMYTPSEISHEYSDESFFEDSLCQTGYIREVVELPDGDYLIGFVGHYGTGDDMLEKAVDYYKLSEIRLGWCKLDQEDTGDENDTE